MELLDYIIMLGNSWNHGDISALLVKLKEELMSMLNVDLLFQY